jgi:circadian clock protein KaiC
MVSATQALPDQALTGIAGLDDILNGGLTPHRMYRVEGTPGTGKTTLGLGFLLAGAAVGETGLYITLAEAEVELRAAATTHGWTLGPVELFEMVPADGLGEDQEQTLLRPSEVELGETVRDVMPGGGRLTLTVADVVVDQRNAIRLEAGGYVRLLAVDTGTGMDRTTLARATEPFFSTKGIG